MRQAVVRGGLCSEWASVSTMAAGSPQATNWTVTSPSPLCPLGVLSQLPSQGCTISGCRSRELGHRQAEIP